MSNINGELRKGKENANDWIIQDDGYGFPCFYNLQTQEIVHEDPRFIHNTNDNIEAQKLYIMSELRYSLYFCKDYWDKYLSAMTLNDTKSINTVLLMISQSLKPKHLASFLIRAQSIYKIISVIDEPINAEILQELEYANFISARMNELMKKGELLKETRKIAKRKAMDKIESLKPEKVILHCPQCGQITDKHLDICKTCGKKQLFL